MPRLHALVGVLLLPGLASVVGCGSSETLANVQGKLTVGGKPLDKIQIQFLPDPSQGTIGPRSTGVTDAAGYFILTTDDGRAGAIVGQHVVILTDVSKGDAPRSPPRLKSTARVGEKGKPPAEPEPVQLRIGLEYASSAKSGLKKTVEAGDQTINFDLPAPPVVEIKPPMPPE
jgi:hypothetical protein